MYKKCSLFFCTIALLLLVGYEAEANRKIPDYIHICKRTDPQVTRCVWDAVETLRPRLKAGLPELDVPSLDPLHIDEVEIFRGDGPSNFKAYLRNLEVKGAGDFEITKIKLNVDKVTYRAGVKFPKLDITGDYDIDAKVLIVPIKGQGKFSANVTDCDGQAVIKGEIITYNGHRQVKFKSITLHLKFTQYHVNLENLFNGDPILGRAANEVINDANQELLDRARQFIERKVSEILVNAANRITDDLDYDEVFPEK